jgi:hypothetical protein
MDREDNAGENMSLQGMTNNPSRCVRMAVVARREQVVWMILQDSFLLTAPGLMIGLPPMMLVGGALTSSLYGVKAI